MSRYIATRAIRGANALVTEAELMLHKGTGSEPAARSKVEKGGPMPAHEGPNQH